MLAELKQKYRALSKVKKATFWITFCSFLRRGISFITVPIFTRILTTTEYGTVSVYQGWESMAINIITLGIAYGGFNNGMIKYKNDREGYTSAVAGLTITLGIIWIGLCFLLTNQASSFTGLTLSLLIVLVIEVTSGGICDIWMSRMKYDFDYRKMIAVSLFLGIVSPAVGIPLVLVASDKVFARIASFAFAQCGLAVVLSLIMFKRGKKLYCREYWKFALLFNVPLLPHYLSEVILNSSDRIMIGNMLGATDAGIYSIAYTTGMLMTILTTSLNSTVAPWLYRKLEEHSYDRIRKVSIALLGGIAVIILGVNALAPDIVAILAPATYSEAMGLVPIISASVFFIFLYSYCANIEFYFEKTKLAAVASVVAALLNIGLNLIFIPVFGYVAAGYSTLICYAAMALAHYLFAQHVMEKNRSIRLLNGNAIWGIGCIFCVVSIVFSSMYGLPIVRYGLVLAICILVLVKRKQLTSLVRKELL